LQPIGSFGLTCTSGLLPAFGGASWAYALVEKQTAVKITSAFIVISRSPSFWRLMIGPNVSVLIECKPDESKHDQDGSGHHHPMGVLPIEQQVEHFGPCPLSRYFPFAGDTPSSHFPFAL
jgi:hypothetical protein